MPELVTKGTCPVCGRPYALRPDGLVRNHYDPADRTRWCAGGQEESRPDPTIAALRTVLADRERELLTLKGPCSFADRGCRLHYAHSGPCDIPQGQVRNYAFVVEP